MKPILDFIVDGKIFAQRNWEIIPRVGDTIILDDGKKWVEVARVIWANDSKAPPSVERQWVQLLCKTIDDPTRL